MRFLHAADVHLDSPLTGLPDYPGAPVDEIRNATRRAFRNMTDLAIERQLDFVVIAGDLYDGDWKSYDTGLVFRMQMARLDQAGIPVFIVKGNHDAQSRITKSLGFPDNVHIFSHRKPETVKIENLRVALHGQSFKNQDVTENLSANYPKPLKGWFNIGVLHTAAEGREGHLPYAPCSVGELSAKGYDYWALGHVHKREILGDAPYIVFPGNLQGRHIRETAPEGKGCTLVSVDESGKATLSHEAVDTVRWDAVTVDVSSVEDMGTIVERARNELIKAHDEADGRILAARVTFVGDTRLHGRLLSDGDSLLSEVRGAAMDVAVGEVWIEKVVIATQPTASLEDLSAYGGTLGDVAKSLQELQNDSAFHENLTDILKPLFEKLPAEVLERTPELQAMKDGGDELEAVMRQASDIVVTRLAGMEIDE